MKKLMSVGLVCTMIFFGNIVGVFADSHGSTHPSTGQGPQPAAKTVGEDGHMQISDNDRCPVCGMYPAKRPKTAAAMVLKDGRTFYFCGNGCLLRTYMKSDQYLKVPSDQIQRVVAKEYFGGESVDALSAWWVAGSDVVGPMGPALVVLKDEASVSQFKARHGGKKVFQLKQADDALWQELFSAKKK